MQNIVLAELEHTWVVSTAPEGLSDDPNTHQHLLLWRWLNGHRTPVWWSDVAAKL